MAQNREQNQKLPNISYEKMNTYDSYLKSTISQIQNVQNKTNLNIIYRPVVQEDDIDSQSGADNSHTELSVLEKDCCKQNFQFYDKAKAGHVQRFELPMLLQSK